MTTTDAKREPTSLNGPGSREDPDEDKLWDTIAGELLHRGYDTLEETLRQSYKTFTAGTGPRKKAETGAATETDGSASQLNADQRKALEGTFEGKDAVETLNNAITTLCDPEERFADLVKMAMAERAHDRESDPADKARSKRSSEKFQKKMENKDPQLKNLGILVDLEEHEETSKAALNVLGERAREIVAEHFSSACNSSRHIELLATYLYARELKIWEDTSDWDGIRQIIQASRDSFEGVRQQLRDRTDDETDQLVHLIMCLSNSIDPAMSVESGLNCSCPLTMQKYATEIRESSGPIEAKLLQRMQKASSVSRGCLKFVQDRAAIDCAYFGAVARVSDAVIAYIADDEDADSTFAKVDVEVRAAESAIEGDVYESELRSHRLGLESLRDAWPRLFVDEGKTIYCFPFALPGVDPSTLIKAAWECDGGDRWEFGGLEADLSELELTDMWDGQAGSDDRFTGVKFKFSKENDPKVRPVARDILQQQGDLSFSLEIRLSRLGNHYLRFESPLKDCSIHELNQAMRRAMQQMGDETVSFAELKKARLYDLAEEMIDSLVDHLVAHINQGDPGVETEPGHSEQTDASEQTEGKPIETFPPRKALPHVIVTARELSLEPRGQCADDETLKDLSIDELRAHDAKGVTLLVQPVRHAAAILEEWSRYSLPDLDDDNAMQPMSFVGNFAYRTTNTTFGLLRGTPEFLIVEHEEAAEFVASLPILLESWMSQIRQETKNLHDGATTKELRDRQLELRELLTKAKMTLAQIRSPDLCLTAVHRKYLDQMFAVAGIERLERELQSHFDVLNAHLDALAAQAETREQERVDNQTFYLSAGAVLVGVPSVAALFTLLDQGERYKGGVLTLESLVLFGILIVVLIFVSRLPGARAGTEAIRRRVGGWLRAPYAAVKRRMPERKARSSDLVPAVETFTGEEG
jgi:hypothetical protein